MGNCQSGYANAGNLETIQKDDRLLFKSARCSQWTNPPFEQEYVMTMKKFTNRENWMRDYCFKIDCFGDRKIWNLAIPGTHHSALWDVQCLIKLWAVCQCTSIKEQLEAGIRFLDLRICDDNPNDVGGIWISHTALSATTFEFVLEEVKKFVVSHEKEIVIISVTKDKKRTVSLAGKKKALKIFEETFGDMLMKEDETDCTLNELWKRGKKIAVTGNPCLKTAAARKSWDYTWSPDGFRLLRLLDAFVEKNPKNLPGELHILEVVETGAPSPIYSASKVVNKVLLERLRGPWKKYEFNVIIHDFMDDDVIEAILDYNNVCYPY